MATALPIAIEIELTTIVPLCASELGNLSRLTSIVSSPANDSILTDFQPALFARLRGWNGYANSHSSSSESCFVFSQPSSPGRPFNWLPLSIVWAANASLAMACTRTSSRSESCTQPSFLANRVAEWLCLAPRLWLMQARQPQPSPHWLPPHPSQPPIGPAG